MTKAMSIYKFRILLEAKEDIFRDIEIKSTQNFEDLHEIIVASFGFDNSQMASFYLSNEDWEKGQEISLFDMQMDEDEEKVLVMSDTIINSKVNRISSHLLYSYDFLNLYNFFIELIEIKVKEDSKAFYPRVVYSQGKDPEKKMDNALSEEEMANELLRDAGFDEEGDDGEDAYGDDMFEGLDDYENYD
jgi:hypothetical protein